MIEKEPPNISDDAIIVHSDLAAGSRVFQKGEVRHSSVGRGASVGNDAVVVRSRIGSFVSVNRRNYINDSSIGDLSYTGQNTMLHFARVGRFCSIAANVDIGGFDHGYDRATTLPSERFELLGGDRVDPSFASGADEREPCVIGNDVWIASGVVVLRKATVGDGVVIGAGAVVTKDIPPFAIAVGVPARVVGWRFERSVIDRMLDIAWWKWPLNVIAEHKELLLRKVDDSTLRALEAVSSAL